MKIILAPKHVRSVSKNNKKIFIFNLYIFTSVIIYSIVFQESSCKPHFRDDTTYVIPMSLALEDVTAACHYIELHVVLWLYTVSVQTNGSSPEPDLNGQTTKDPADGLFF